MPYVSSIEKFGIEKGKKEGIREGILQGIKQGIEQGIEQEKLVIAQRLVAMGIADLESIAQATELDLVTIKKLKRARKKKVH